MLAAAALAACNALSGVDELVVEPTAAGRADGGDAPRGPGGDGDGGATRPPDVLDAGTSDGTVDGAPGPLPVFGATFDTASECESWGGSGTRQHDALGHAAPGSCRLCAPAGGDVDLERTVTAATGGRYSVSAWARRVPGAATPTSVGLVFQAGGSNVSLTRALDGTWSEIRGNKVTTPAGAAITLKVGIRGGSAGDCMLVDDVSLTAE